MKYFAHITEQKDKSYLVDFPELEGCFTEGKTLTQAKRNASEALNGWLASCCDLNLNIPYPKQRRCKNFYPIMVDFQIALAIVLRRKRKQKSPSLRDERRHPALQKRQIQRYGHQKNR